MKYRIKYNDPNDLGWLWLTPLALITIFLSIFGINGNWVIESKKHWWNKWKIINSYSNKTDAYIKYFKLKYNLDIKNEIEFTHNKNKNKKQTCVLVLNHNEHPYSPEYLYSAGYKPYNYSEYYHVCYSPYSYEDALLRLYNDLEIKKLIKKQL